MVVISVEGPEGEEVGVGDVDVGVGGDGGLALLDGLKVESEEVQVENASGALGPEAKLLDLLLAAR